MIKMLIKMMNNIFYHDQTPWRMRICDGCMEVKLVNHHLRCNDGMPFPRRRLKWLKCSNSRTISQRSNTLSWFIPQSSSIHSVWWSPAHLDREWVVRLLQECWRVKYFPPTGDVFLNFASAKRTDRTDSLFSTQVRLWNMKPLCSSTTTC